MNPIWETSVKIRAFDVDANNRLKISTIFDYFQDAASLHADHLRVGYDDLIPKGFFWVLSWAKFEFSSYPKFKDEIRIQTWGKKQFKLYSIRDFLMLDKNDLILCKATTAWLLLDAKTLRPKILPQLFSDVKFFEAKSALDDLPEKFPNDIQTEKIYSRQIKYSDIDLNKHANNAKYAELILDCFSEEFHKLNQIKSMTITFVSETRFGEMLTISKGTQSDTHFIEGKNLKTDKIVFRALVEWIKDSK